MNTERKIHHSLLTALFQVGTNNKDYKLVGTLGKNMLGFLIPRHVELENSYENEKFCLQLADGLLEQINTKPELKAEAEEKFPTKLPRAKGPANVFSELQEKKRHVVFAYWKKAADVEEREEEGENEAFCSRYRKLCAYYLPIQDLIEAEEEKLENPFIITKFFQRLGFTAVKKNKRPHYGIAKIRRYLASSLVDTNDPLDHVLRIKFAMADKKKDEAMRLIHLSSLNLNLAGADLRSMNYLFTQIDLSNACLENTLLNDLFFLSQDDVPELPKSLKGANLKNAICYSLEYDANDIYHHYCGRDVDTFHRDLYIKKLAEADGGLDVRFIRLSSRGGIYYRQSWGASTLLHEGAKDTEDEKSIHNVLILLRNGASTRMRNEDEDLPCSMALKDNELRSQSLFFRGFSSFYDTLFNWQPIKHVPLLALLSHVELREQKKRYQRHRRNMIIAATIFFLIFVSAIAAAISAFHLFSFLSSNLPIGVSEGQMHLSVLCTTYSMYVLIFMPVTYFLYVPRLLSNIFFGYAEIEQAIDRQCLANNKPEYKVHLLLQKKHLFQQNAIPDNLLTAAEELLFASLTEKQLQQQLLLNNTIAQQGITDGKSTIIKGAIFAAIAIIVAVIPFVAVGLLPQVGSTLSMSFFPSLVYPLTRLSLTAIFTGIASIRKANAAQVYINGMITTELTKRLGDEKKPVPEKTLEYKRTPTPQPMPMLAAELRIDEVQSPRLR